MSAENETKKAKDRSSLPFSGIKVLSFTQIGQGPAAVQNFADFGADVIKIERPGTGAFERTWSGPDAFREGISYFFLSLNRNQKSLTVDLKSEKGKKIIYRLVEGADVLVENYRPGVMQKLGLGYDELSKINPRLIYCATNGFGSSGPWRDRPGQDLILQCFTGMASMNGQAGDPPIPCGMSAVDFNASSLLSFATATALFQRERTGRGQYVETSLLESAVSLQTDVFFYFLNGWDVTKRAKANITSYFAAPYGIYKTADGYIAMSLNPISRLRKVIDAPGLAKFADDDALRRREEIAEVIAEILAKQKTAYWIDLFGKADIWCGPVNDYHQFVNEPQFQASKITMPIQHPILGEVQHIRPLVRLGEVPLDQIPRVPPPQLGEHTDEILQGLGMSQEEIRDLREEQVV